MFDAARHSCGMIPVMGRKLFTIAAAASAMRQSHRLLTPASSVCLVLAVASTALWAWSFRRANAIQFGGQARTCVVWWAGGRVIAHVRTAHESGKTGWRWHSYHEYGDEPWENYIPGVAGRKLAWGDFGYVKGSYLANSASIRGRFRMIVFPGWLPPIVLGLLPAWWFPRLRRARRARRRLAAGLCVQCAYDLRGNPTGVCPECGTPAVPIPAA